jgi:hypothetical protein
MNMRNLPRLISTLLLLCALMPVFQPRAGATSKPLVVIVSASTPLKEISTALLRRAFLGEPTEYASGRRLIPINHLPGTPTRAQFDRGILDLEPDEVGRFWIDRRVRDQAPPPRTVPSVDFALRVVMSLPGAISYVPPELVNDKVRALTIDGRAAGQPDYLLEE